MPKFIVDKGFLFKGIVRREGQTLEVSEDLLLSEMELGKHPDNGRPESGLLNHCYPADDATAELVQGMIPEKEKVVKLSPEQIEEAINEIKAKMDDMGRSYRPGWKLDRFQKELIKAQKETGE